MKRIMIYCLMLIVCLFGAMWAAPAGAQEPEEESKELSTLKPRVKVVTNKGEFIIQLDLEQAPATSANFLRYVKEGFYDGTVFHRIIKDFVVQGGGYTKDMDKKKGLHDPVKNEWNNGRSHLRSTVAMARLGGQPDSARAQFFINLRDNANLNFPQPDGAGYANFGHVMSGMDVVDAIAQVELAKHPKMSSNTAITPKEAVIIESVKLLDAVEYDKIVEKVTEKREARIEEIRAPFAALEEEFKIKIPELKKTRSGLMYAIVREGTGQRPDASDKVKVHYKGVLLDGSEFDNSYKRGNPSEFGLDQVIRGWTEGLQLMKEGGMAILVAPPELAYGDQDRPGLPANSTLVFLVELKEIVSPPPPQR